MSFGRCSFGDDFENVVEGSVGRLLRDMAWCRRVFVVILVVIIFIVIGIVVVMVWAVIIGILIIIIVLFGARCPGQVGKVQGLCRECVGRRQRLLMGPSRLDCGSLSQTFSSLGEVRGLRRARMCVVSCLIVELYDAL